MGIPIPRPQPRHVARVEKLLGDLRIEGLHSAVIKPVPRDPVTFSHSVSPQVAPALGPAYAPKGVSMGAGGPPTSYRGGAPPEHREMPQRYRTMGVEESAPFASRGVDRVKGDEEESLDFLMGSDDEDVYGGVEEVVLPKKSLRERLAAKIRRVRIKESPSQYAGGVGEVTYKGIDVECYRSSVPASLGARRSLGGYAAAGAGTMRAAEPVPAVAAGVARVAKAVPHIDDIQTLEKILSEVYTSDVTITSIKDLPVTRKLVKRVFFDVKGYLCQVFVLKADPSRTNKELCAYRIAYNHAVPTGMPIGFMPESAEGKYPFETALLGGEIINDAGEPYKELLGNLELTPHLMMGTAKAIAEIIADYQMSLTYAYAEFRDRKLHIPYANPKKEIKDRMLARLALEEYEATDLLNAAEELASKQSNWRLVSHGDTHLGNITTVFDIYSRNETQMQKGWNLSRFGVIDWESICMDRPHSDLIDFFVHFERVASAISRRPYTFNFDEINLAYLNRLKNRMLEKGIKLNPNDLNRDTLIQNALWHAYEILDPTREGSPEEESIAEHHIASMKVALQDLYSDPECRASAKAIEDAVDRILELKD